MVGRRWDRVVLLLVVLKGIVSMVNMVGKVIVDSFI